jgi:hypothetical protein
LDLPTSTNDPNSGLRRETLQLHPSNEVQHLCRSPQWFGVPLHQTLSVDHSGVSRAICHLLQRCEQRWIRSARNNGLIPLQRWIERPILEVLPDLSTEGLCLRYRHWILEATQTIDKTILTIHPHTELDDAVIVP